MRSACSGYRQREYLVDRALQRSGRSYTDIRGIRDEDLAVQESMGGDVPYEARNADRYRVRSAALVLPREVGWHDGAAEALLARV
jgi:hypothetical protein